jgi:GTP cyclohydrolase I
VVSNPINRARLEAIGRDLMDALGVERTPSTTETPARWAKWWIEFLEYDDSKTMTTFTSEAIDQLVVVSGIRVWSICEHHLLPFYCDVSMAYITRDRVLGLSKFARIAHLHAHRLNVQERLVSDIANHLHEATNSPDVAVIAQGEHLCMTMRGIRSPAVMTSSAMHGLFRTDIAARTEFLRIAKIGS